MRVTESGVSLEVPGTSTEGVEEAVFYNPRQTLKRDLTIAALRAARTERGVEGEYLDAMTASGIRGIRAAKDGWRTTVCDRDPEAVALARRNLENNGLAVRDGRGTDDAVGVVQDNTNAVLHGERTDVVDLDPYGTPMPFADAAFAGTRELVCVTATDTAPLCGAHLNSGIRSYGTVPRNTEYHPEMGVRTLLSGLARSAARFDVGVTPLCTHATSHYVRTYLGLERRATAADRALEALGYVHHCPECLYRETALGLIADPPASCSHCRSDQLLTAGPLWLERVHDPAFLAAMADSVDPAFDTAAQATELLDTLAVELEVPTHYDQHRICKRLGVSAGGMRDLLERLRDAGCGASRTHYGGTTFKTDAPLEVIETATLEGANDST